MFVSVPFDRINSKTVGPPIMSLQGEDVQELRQLLRFWRTLPFELLLVQETIKDFVGCEGWRLLSPSESGLKAHYADMLKFGELVAALDLETKKRADEIAPAVAVRYEEVTPLVFVRYTEEGVESSHSLSMFTGCYGSLVEHAAPEGKPSVRISKEQILKAHCHCETILAAELARLSIDSHDFIKFGAKARSMDAIPEYYCVAQEYGELELPDLSALDDSSEKKMLENVFVTCKQLESHLSITQQGIAGVEPPEVPQKIKDWAKDILEDQRLSLEGKSTRHPQRKRIYDKVSERKRANPDDYAKAVAYIESQKPTV